jgi:hypothetical protein
MSKSLRSLPGHVSLAGVLLLCVAAPAQQVTVVPQTALSPCPAVTVVSREEIPAGSLLAASPDGRWLARLAHTAEGAEIFLRHRPPRAVIPPFPAAPATPNPETYSKPNLTAAPATNLPQPPQEKQDERMILLEKPVLPAGIPWRVHEMRFSDDAALLVVRSVGAVDVYSVAEAKRLHRILFDKEKQTYPGQFALSSATPAPALAVAYWPAESVFADATATKPVEFRLLDALTGSWQRSLMLPFEASDAWTALALSPDAARLAVLRRPTRWPGRSQLAVHSTADAKLLWQAKLDAEDIEWTHDARALLALGSELHWLDAATGKPQRKAAGSAGSSEFQRLRVSGDAALGVGHFARYSRWRRLLRRGDTSESLLLVWRMEAGTVLCEASLRPSQRAEVWPASGGELIALEESYDVKPPLRLLQSARIVTYRVQ